MLWYYCMLLDLYAMLWENKLKSLMICVLCNATCIRFEQKRPNIKMSSEHLEIKWEAKFSLLSDDYIYFFEMKAFDNEM